jgi:methionyl-tRNA formyltransferase
MEIDHRHLKIFSATTTDRKGKPGEISQEQDELIVAAGTGALSLAKVQLEGKKRMSAAEFLRGHSRLAQL